MRQAILAAVVIALATSAESRTRAVHQPQRLLWIGAHPDDEILVSPLFGRECVERGVDCAMLVMTEGGVSGTAAVRAAEMQQAAAALHATLTQWTFADIMSDVEATWAAEAGGRDALLDRMASQIVAVAPTAIYTFDPAHGTTCHPAHRAVARLVIEALARVAVPPPVYFVETTPQFRSAVTQPIDIDAAAQWPYFVHDAQIHASQFPPAQVEAFASVPVDQRRVYLLDAKGAAEATYTLTCD